VPKEVAEDEELFEGRMSLNTKKGQEKCDTCRA